MKNMQKLELINRASMELLEAISLVSTYEIIVKYAMKLTGAKYGSIFEIKERHMQRVYTSDNKLKKIIPRDRGNTYYAFKTKKPYLVQAVDYEKIHPKLYNLGIKSDLIIPLSYGKDKYAVLSVLSPQNKTFTKHDLDTLKKFMPLASFAIRQQKLRVDLKKALDERDLFISIAAHELKTPLTTVLAYTQLLDKRTPKENSQDKLLISKLKDSENRLDGLISDFLNTSRIKSGKIVYEFRKVNLIDIAKDVLEHFYLRFPSHKVKYSINCMDNYCEISADPVKIHQAILNILNNAGKFSPNSSPIELKLYGDEEKVYITVSDKGSGIPKKELEHIFDQFYRGKNSNKQGMGLGLFLAKNIIDSHNGKIRIISEEGKGTKATIELPLYQYGENRDRNYRE